jgi:hypothetical protein
MPAIVLIIALVCLPLVVGACLAAVGYKACRARRLLEFDVEQAQNANGTRHTIEMRDLESSRIYQSWPFSSTHLGTVPTNVAPVAKSMSQKLEIRGIGGGFVEHYGSTTSNASGQLRHEHTRVNTNEKIRNNDQFENADLYAGPGWQWNTLHPPQPNLQPEQDSTTHIPAPQPIYISPLYSGYNSTARPTTMIYGDDAKVAEALEEIDRRKSLVGNMGNDTVAQSVAVHGDGFEDVNLNRQTEEWRHAESAARNFSQNGVFDEVFSVETESMHSGDDGVGEGKYESPTKRGEQDTTANRSSDSSLIIYASTTIDSLGSEQSITQCNSRDSNTAASPVSRKDSWSTQSSRTSRRSTDSARKDVDKGQSHTPSTRDSSSDPLDSKASMMGRLRLSADAAGRRSVEKGGERRHSGG